MTWTDHARRGACVVLVALALVTVPAMANATFRGTSTGLLMASTAQLVAPTGVTGTYRCTKNGKASEGIAVTVSDFTDGGPAGATYEYAVSRGGTPVQTVSSPARTATVDTGLVTSDGTATTWTLTIRATLGSWTGPYYARAVTCPSQSNSSGSL